MNPPANSSPGLLQLGRQLLPLSLSDAAMAVADPMLAVTLTRLPAAEVQLAALGVVKAIAVFLESPIIMVLHASTALSGWLPSRRALGRFVAGLALALTLLLLALSLPQLYDWLMFEVYSLQAEVAGAARWPLLLFCLWPALIAWRRFYQGHLILQGQGRTMGMASLFRVGGFSLTLVVGAQLGIAGAALGATALMAGLVVEASLVFYWARRSPLPSREPAKALPEDVPAVGRYYAPLALTMLLMWGGRAALVAILARAEDHALALAAWAASWGFVILVANLTRMVQQLVIKYADQVPAGRLFALGGWAGGLCSVLLLALGYTPVGQSFLQLLIGSDPALGAAAQQVVRYGLAVPLLVACQNVLQGFCIANHRNRWINGAGLVGVVVTLIGAQWGVLQGWPGATVGAVSVTLGLAAEVAILVAIRPWRSSK